MKYNALFAVLVLTTSICFGGTVSVTRYVATNSPSPAIPYITWSTAAHTIQTAINASINGDIVVVTDGVYSAGGGVTPGFAVSNRVVITNFINVYSVNGPSVTFIKGQFDPATGGPGSNAVRCAYIYGGGKLSGFTLYGGATATTQANLYVTSGGGLFLEGGTVSNCVITGNRAHDNGGGVILDSPASVLTHSIISSNITVHGGGGMWFNGSGTLRNCLVYDNVASNQGGGAVMYGARIESCTFAANYAGTHGGGIYDQGAPPTYTSVVVNTIIYGNQANLSNPEYNVFSNVLFFCCTQPLPTGGVGNITEDPGYIGIQDYHIRANSACVNAGSNQSWMTTARDIDGQPRLRGGIPDIGADEAFQYMATSISNQPNQMIITWATITNGTFQMQYSTNLLLDTWGNAGSTATSIAQLATITHTNPPLIPVCYRLMFLGP